MELGIIISSFGFSSLYHPYNVRTIGNYNNPRAYWNTTKVSRGSFGLLGVFLRGAGLCHLGNEKAVHARDVASAGVSKERCFAKSPERRRSPRSKCMNALQRFGDRDFAEGVPPPSAFTLTSEPAAEACLTGSQPGMPCRIRSAFFDGVMWP